MNEYTHKTSFKHISYEDKLEFYKNVRQWHNKFIYQ